MDHNEIRNSTLDSVFFDDDKTSSAPPSILLCADGKGPLLEGEGGVLPCLHDCPDGFDCERSRHTRIGICCPNLAALHRLYNSEKVIRDEENEGTVRWDSSPLGMEARDEAIDNESKLVYF